MLDTIITVEMTCDQACAILASLKYAINENDDWLDINEKHDRKDDVEDMNNLMREVGYNILNEMKSAGLDPSHVEL